LIIWKLHSFDHLKCGIYTGDTENSKLVREIVWINTVTYAGGKTQLRIQKKLDRFGGKSQAQLGLEMKKSTW